MENPIGPGKGGSTSNVKSNWNLGGRISEREFKALGARLAKHCPQFWLAVSGKRYIIPNYRQQDYYSQEILDHLLAFFLATYVSGDYGKMPDHIIRLMYIQAVMAIQQRRPIYFLERELGEVLLRTKTPGDLETEDIHWRRSMMRIMLPRELICLERPNEPKRSLMYLDIGKAKAEVMLELPSVMRTELENFALMYDRLKSRTIPTPVFDQDGMVVATQLSGNLGDDPGLNYGLVRPFEGRKLKDIKVGGHFDTGSICDETDDMLLARMEHLAIQVLLFMGSVPLEYEITANEEPSLRKLEILKDRVIPGLYPAKFVGRSQYRPRQKPTYHTANWSGRKLPAHWRCGHWKRQVVGAQGEDEPGSHRKLIWIEPYETFGPDDEEQKPPHAA